MMEPTCGMYSATVNPNEAVWLCERTAYVSYLLTTPAALHFHISLYCILRRPTRGFAIKTCNMEAHTAMTNRSLRTIRTVSELASNQNTN